MYIIVKTTTGEIQGKGNQLSETDMHYVVDGVAYMKHNTQAVYAESVPNKPYYYNGVFKNISKQIYEKRQLEIIADLESSNKTIMKLLDDLTEFCVTLGFSPNNKIKNELQRRKTLRQELDGEV